MKVTLLHDMTASAQLSSISAIHSLVILFEVDLRSVKESPRTHRKGSRRFLIKLFSA